MVIIRTRSRPGGTRGGARWSDYILRVRTVVLHRRSGPDACSASCNLWLLRSTTKHMPCIVSFRTVGTFCKTKGSFFRQILKIKIHSRYEPSPSIGQPHGSTTLPRHSARATYGLIKRRHRYYIPGTSSAFWISYAHDLSGVGGARGATLCACH